MRDDSDLDRIGEDAAQQPDRTSRRARAAAHDGFAAQLLRLDGDACLAGHDVLQDLVDVDVGEILDPSRTDQWNDVSIDAAGVGDDRCRLLRAPALAEDEARIQIGDIEGAKFSDGDRLVVELAGLNLVILAASTTALVACWFAIRDQVAIADREFLKSMIPHHAAAILMCEEARIGSPEIRNLCKAIVSGQQAETDEMKALLRKGG